MLWNALDPGWSEATPRSPKPDLPCDSRIVYHRAPVRLRDVVRNGTDGLVARTLVNWLRHLRSLALSTDACHWAAGYGGSGAGARPRGPVRRGRSGAA